MIIILLIIPAFLFGLLLGMTLYNLMNKKDSINRESPKYYLITNIRPNKVDQDDNEVTLEFSCEKINNIEVDKIADNFLINKMEGLKNEYGKESV